MQDTISCPSCHVRLRLPPEPPPAGMTCPRCLAGVPYPTITSIQATPSEPARPAAPEPPAASPGPSRCPSCGRPTEPQWLFCPHCEEPLRRDRGARSITGVDRDVRRDSSGTKIFLGLLTVLGGIGTFWYFAAAVADQNAGMAGAGICFLLFLGFFSTLLMFARTRDNPSARGIGRVVLGTLTLVGIVIASGCSLVLAAGIFVFVVCMAGGRF